ncbi:MAG: NAD(P)H-binding protein, partial [Pyrinomonadaceae bacterium]|nr:NAD(P)H-binding protein [Pyrinomonadaceae bacterium]
MKITLTGSLGHIGKPLTAKLIGNNHIVTVISSKPEKQKQIEEMGAEAAIGSLENAEFVANSFRGADLVYCMVPPANYFDHNLDLSYYYRSLGNNFSQAIIKSNVSRVINLSTFGADLEKGNGILRNAHDVENILNELPTDVSVTQVRPTCFFYNLYGYVDSIKTRGFIAANYGAEKIIPWVSTLDIADTVVEEIEKPFIGRKIRYISSDERTGNETASIIGAAIGKPDLEWKLFSNEQTQNGLESIGMQPRIAAGLVEMYESLHNGVLSEDYYRNNPMVTGKVKLEDFAVEF